MYKYIFKINSKINILPLFPSYDNKNKSIIYSDRSYVAASKPSGNSPI